METISSKIFIQTLPRISFQGQEKFQSQQLSSTGIADAYFALPSHSYHFNNNMKFSGIINFQHKQKQWVSLVNQTDNWKGHKHWQSSLPVFGCYYPTMYFDIDLSDAPNYIRNQQAFLPCNFQAIFGARKKLNRIEFLVFVELIEIHSNLTSKPWYPKIDAKQPSNPR